MQFRSQKVLYVSSSLSVTHTICFQSHFFFLSFDDVNQLKKGIARDRKMSTNRCADNAVIILLTTSTSGKLGQNGLYFFVFRGTTFFQVTKLFVIVSPSCL